MSIFEQLKTYIPTDKFENVEHVYVIGVQHLLETTGSLIEKIVNIGIKPQNIFLTGKIYSTNDGVKQKLRLLGVNVFDSNLYYKPGFFKDSLTIDVQIMWAKLREKIPSKPSKIIVLDDGGYTLKEIPDTLLFNYHNIVGIEQTSSGIWKIGNTNFPVINVAESATKLCLEPIIVYKALKKRIADIIETVSPKKIGVISCGTIGSAIIKYLSKKYKVHIYDQDSDKMKKFNNCIKYDSLIALYKSCNVIISCTGRDVSNPNWLDNTNENKLLISASSGDIEFLSLLNIFSSQNKQYYPLDTLKIKVKNNIIISIFRGGTVANFDGSPHSAPSNEIQLTRGLLFAAFIQALKLTKYSQHGLIKLNAKHQKKIVELWFKNQPQMRENYKNDVLENFRSEKWIKMNS